MEQRIENQSRRDVQTLNEENYASCHISGSKRGRPSYNIKEEQLSFLLEKGFKACEISKIIGVSKRTIERRMEFFGLSASGNLCYLLSNAGELKDNFWGAIIEYN